MIQANSRVRQSPSHSLTEESFSESCSDLDVHNDSTSSNKRDFPQHQTSRFSSAPLASRAPFASQTSGVFSAQSSPRSLGSKPLPASMSKSFTAKSSRSPFVKNHSSGELDSTFTNVSKSSAFTICSIYQRCQSTVNRRHWK